MKLIIFFSFTLKILTLEDDEKSEPQSTDNIINNSSTNSDTTATTTNTVKPKSNLTFKKAGK